MWDQFQKNRKHKKLIKLLRFISTECKNFSYFRVSYLLDESGFLTPKLFNYISLNWGRIIEMILNQFEVDRENSISCKNTHKREQNLN